MDRACRWVSLAPFTRRGRLRWLTAGLALFGPACSQPGPLVAAEPVRVMQARAAAPDAMPPASLPKPAPLPTAVKALPISMDTVLRLAEEQNAQIALAREKVHEANASQDVAAYAWLPNVYAGMAYYRHEGGIQNEDGTLTHSSSGALFPGLEIDARLDLKEVAFQQINAERQVWQQKGELSRLTSETVLEAASSYIDLLTARTGELLARDLEKQQEDMLKRAQSLFDVEKSTITHLAVESIQIELAGQHQAISKLHQQGDAAAAKLAYLLGVGPCVELVPVDAKLLPFALVDATPPACDLVAQALANGPGVRELEGLLAVIQQGMDRAQGLGKFLPTFEVRMDEGGFGAGPGARLDWDNRWDLVLQARWNLTELVTARERREVAQSRLNQIHLSYQDLRGKLTAGVQESREAIVSGEEQFRWSDSQVRHAVKAHDLSVERLENNAPNSSTVEVMQAIRGEQAAYLAYLGVLNSYNKAQLRLLMLLGPAACKQSVPAPVPAEQK